MMIRRHSLVKLLAALFLLLVSFHVPAQPLEGVSGTWLTIDDETNTPRSILKLFVDKDGKLNGQIIKTYLRKGEKETDTCTKCSQPEFKNKPIVGMVVMWGLKQVDYRKWVDGYILDPTSGKIYRCELTLSPNGQALNVRGYIGFSLLGRTQRWMRVEQ